MKVKQQEIVNATDKLKLQKKELATIKKQTIKTEGDRIIELEEKLEF